ncbi:glycosyltransferase family 2 protein [Pseudokineococcus sp. 1T1Z-3]|uniref:glycosyltransferase family 2 protein n=1 Tax=Pseudokineococcus sp. 1T1Z-3 TaxID=3132745 RepID=UPI0030AC7D05
MSDAPAGTVADVTVVMPAMDREHLIARSLRSAQDQTCPPARVVVVDDASTDGTARVAKTCGADVLTMPERSGSGPARNAGIAQATTRWVAFLDSDDEWLPDHLERLVEGAAQEPGAVMVTAPARATSGRWMGNPSRRVRHLRPQDMLVPSDLVVTSGTMVTSEALAAAGGFRPLRRAQDLDLWLRVLEVGPGVALTEPGVRYHEHAEQASVDKDLMREHFTTILASVDERPWMTPALRQGAWSRVVWDDLRLAQAERRWRDALGSAGWFARRPAAVGALVRVLRRRRQARRRALQVRDGTEP